MIEKEIFVDFRKLTGHARQVMQQNVQKNLLALGFFFGNNGQEPRGLDEPWLHLNSQRWNPRALSLIGGDEELPTGDFHMLDVCNDCDKLLKMAKEIMTSPRHLTIEGVQVVITPKEMTLNPSMLLARVAAEAQRQQEFYFGAGA